jgi:hypothetical protein
MATQLPSVLAMQDALMWKRPFVGCTVLMCLFGCGADSPAGSSARSPSAPSVVVPTGPAATAAEGTIGRSAAADVVVNALDACDPATFNAALGAGTCARNGGVTFDDFIAQLTRLGSVGSWHFAPTQVQARRGERFLVINRGGETHTFTEVEEFGGGIVPRLNELAHLTTVAPECQTLGNEDFIPAGGTYQEEVEHDEAEKYQCCIHPWMRLTTRASEQQHD